ncbi:MAG TPA: hypothetical protein VLQ93_25490 [Myxococcaceae bacterium]|nr:hypothetical protein [Myxococcaceae bacterium]
MLEGTQVARLGELALAWLLTRKEGKGARSELSRTLKPFAEHRWSSGEWSTRLDETLATLEEGGLATRTARNGLALTPQGRAHALAWLGVKSASGLTWKQLKSKHLLARALELPASSGNLSRLGSAEGMRAVLVQKHLGMEAPGSRSLAQVRDALCWKQLGVETDKPFTLAAVQAVLLSRVLQAPREVTAPQALQQLAARSVGAKRSDADSLRLAALRSWLVPAAPTSPSSFEASPAEEDLRDFASRVLQAAKGSTSGRFGEGKVFISHVWRALKDQVQGLDEQAFKDRLVEANQKRLLSLSRADMVEAMDPTDVSASEIHSATSTFHFIALS